MIILLVDFDSHRLDQIIELENALLMLAESDFYDGALQLYRALNYPVVPREEPLGVEPRQFVYMELNNTLFGKDEWNCLNVAGSISNLFEIETLHFFGSATETIINSQIKIVFLGVDLFCSLNERSQIVHAITRILNKGYRHPVFILFRNGKSIVFSGLVYETEGDETSGKVYLSDWVDCASFGETEIDKLRLLSFEYHINDIAECYLDMIHSVARGYYLYKESYISAMMDYFIRGDGDFTLAESSFVSASVKQLASECYVHHQAFYDFDFTHEDEQTDLLMISEDDWLLDEVRGADLSFEDIQESLVEELGIYNGCFDDDEIGNEEYDIPEEYFDDPIKLLEFLEKYDCR